MKFYALILAAVFFAAPAAGQPKEKPWYKSKQFWVSTAISVAAAVADGEASLRCQRRDPFCAEFNPAFSVKPSRKKLYLIGGLTIVVERALVVHVWREDARTGKAVAWTFAAGRAVIHGTHAAHAVKVTRACPARGAGCR